MKVSLEFLRNVSPQKLTIQIVSRFLTDYFLFVFQKLPQRSKVERRNQQVVQKSTYRRSHLNALIVGKDSVSIVCLKFTSGFTQERDLTSALSVA